MITECGCYRAIYGDLIKYVPHYYPTYGTGPSLKIIKTTKQIMKEQSDLLERNTKCQKEK